MNLLQLTVLRWLVVRWLMVRWLLVRWRVLMMSLPQRLASPVWPVWPGPLVLVLVLVLVPGQG